MTENTRWLTGKVSMTTGDSVKLYYSINSSNGQQTDQSYLFQCMTTVVVTVPPL